MTLPLKIKNILLEPDPRLRNPNAEVPPVFPWSELEPWTKLMFKAMYRTSVGVGLAAPQAGWNVRLFVMNPRRFVRDGEDNRKHFVFWNPKILEFRGDPKPMHEGCLSLPNVFGDVVRYPEVRIEAMSPAGVVDQVFDGLAAHIIQHEVDHLNGELCFDKLTKAKETSQP